MATAIFYEGGLQANNTLIPIPKLYLSNTAATSPPFTVRSSGGYTAAYADASVQSASIGIVATEPDSALWVRYNGQTVGYWATVYNLADNTYHTMYEFPSGDRLEAKRDPNLSDQRKIDVRYVRSDNTVMYSESWAVIADDLPYLCFTVFENEETHARYFQYAMLLKNSPTYYNLMIGYNSGYGLAWGQYTEIIPVYAWSPFVQLVGNSGTYLLNLSQIDEDVIGEATPEVVTSDGSIFSLSINSALRRLGANLQEGVETKIIYCGDNYATATRRTGEGIGTNIVYITLKFYFRSGLLAFTAPENIAYYEGGDVVSPEVYLSIIYDDTNQVASVDYITYTPNNGNYKYNLDALQNATQLYQLWVWLQDNGQYHAGPYDTGSTDTGGEAGTPRTQDNITISQAPTLGGLDLGIVTLYKPSDTQMASISQFLWSDNVLDNFKKYFNNFADNILSFYVLPYTPTGCPSKTFKVGNMTSEITAVDYVTSRFIDIPMGSVQILPRWGSYLDFSPYTKIEIYLPYIGNHSLDTDELMCPANGDGTLPTELGSTLDLTYRIDMLTGVIVAFIKVNGRLMYQFTGKVGINIPLTGQTFATLVQGIVQAGAGLATTIATGGLTAPLSAAAAVSGTVNATKPSVERIGNISGDNSMLATKSPYIVISSPNKHYIDAQEDFTGFPSYMTGTLSSFSGYTEVVEAHVEGISCTEEERSKILTWLKEGVIL